MARSRSCAVVCRAIRQRRKNNRGYAKAQPDGRAWLRPGVNVSQFVSPDGPGGLAGLHFAKPISTSRTDRDHLKARHTSQMENYKTMAANKFDLAPVDWMRKDGGLSWQRARRRNLPVRAGRPVLFGSSGRRQRWDATSRLTALSSLADLYALMRALAERRRASVHVRQSVGHVGVPASRNRPRRARNVDDRVAVAGDRQVSQFAVEHSKAVARGRSPRHRPRTGAPTPSRRIRWRNTAATFEKKLISQRLFHISPARYPGPTPNNGGSGCRASK